MAWPIATRWRLITCARYVGFPSGVCAYYLRCPFVDAVAATLVMYVFAYDEIVLVDFFFERTLCVVTIGVLVIVAYIGTPYIDWVYDGVSASVLGVVFSFEPLDIPSVLVAGRHFSVFGMNTEVCTAIVGDAIVVRQRDRIFYCIVVGRRAASGALDE